MNDYGIDRQIARLEQEEWWALVRGDRREATRIARLRISLQTMRQAQRVPKHLVKVEANGSTSS